MMLWPCRSALRLSTHISKNCVWDHANSIFFTSFGRVSLKFMNLSLEIMMTSYFSLFTFFVSQLYYGWTGWCTDGLQLTLPITLQVCSLPFFIPSCQFPCPNTRHPCTDKRLPRSIRTLFVFQFHAIFSFQLDCRMMSLGTKLSLITIAPSQRCLLARHSVVHLWQQALALGFSFLPLLLGPFSASLNVAVTTLELQLFQTGRCAMPCIHHVTCASLLPLPLVDNCHFPFFANSSWLRRPLVPHEWTSRPHSSSCVELCESLQHLAVQYSTPHCASKHRREPGWLCGTLETDSPLVWKIRAWHFKIYVENSNRIAHFQITIIHFFQMRSANR